MSEVTAKSIIEAYYLNNNINNKIFIIELVRTTDIKITVKFKLNTTLHKHIIYYKKFAKMVREVYPLRFSSIDTFNIFLGCTNIEDPWSKINTINVIDGFSNDQHS